MHNVKVSSIVHSVNCTGMHYVKVSSIVNSVICTRMHNVKVSSIVHSDADLDPDHGAQCGSALQIGGLTLLGQRSRV